MTAIPTVAAVAAQTVKAAPAPGTGAVVDKTVA
jgi:hypothetical protein